MPVHVHRANGEAKFWIEPQIELAANYGSGSIKESKEANRGK
jgi:hypothetical protein